MCCTVKLRGNALFCLEQYFKNLASNSKNVGTEYARVGTIYEFLGKIDTGVVKMGKFESNSSVDVKVEII